MLQANYAVVKLPTNHSPNKGESNCGFLAPGLGEIASIPSREGSRMPHHASPDVWLKSAPTSKRHISVGVSNYFLIQVKKLGLGKTHEDVLAEEERQPEFT